MPIIMSSSRAGDGAHRASTLMMMRYGGLWVRVWHLGATRARSSSSTCLGVLMQVMWNLRGILTIMILFRRTLLEINNRMMIINISEIMCRVIIRISSMMSIGEQVLVGLRVRILRPISKYCKIKFCPIYRPCPTSWRPCQVSSWLIKCRLLRMISKRRPLYK